MTSVKEVGNKASLEQKRNQNLRELLQLKRKEMPDESYFEDFSARLREAQRSELFKRSSLSILRERFAAYVWGRTFERFAYAGGGAFIAILLATFFFGNFGKVENKLAIVDDGVEYSPFYQSVGDLSTQTVGYSSYSSDSSDWQKSQQNLGNKKAHETLEAAQKIKFEDILDGNGNNRLF